METLIWKYLVASMLLWTAPVRAYVSEQRVQDIASDYAEAAVERAPIYDGPELEARAKTALAAARVAYWETGGSYAPWIEDGRCNDPAWRASHPALLKVANCDGGKSFSMMQIQPEVGEPTGQQLVDVAHGGRWLAAAVGIDRMRRSIRKRGDLCEYTGEAQNKVPCKMGRNRLVWIEGWWRDHPMGSL